MCLVIFPYRFWVSIGTVLKSGCWGTTWIDWMAVGQHSLCHSLGVCPMWHLVGVEKRPRRRTRTMGGGAEEGREKELSAPNGKSLPCLLTLMGNTFLTTYC